MSAIQQLMLATAGAVTPASLFASGPRKGLYRDPSVQASLFQGPGETNPVTATGQSVTYIKDLSGNGLHSTVIGATWQIDGSGKNYLNFTGAGAGMSVAITGWTADMLVSAGIYLATAANHLLYCNSAADATKFFGVSVASDATVTYGSAAGVPDTYVSGTIVSPNNRGNLQTALGSATAKLEENVGLDLSTWTAFKFGQYTGLPYVGRFYGDVAVDAPTGAELNNVRAWLSGKSGVTVSQYTLNKAVAIGDSTIAAYLAQNEVLFYVTTTATKVTLAVAGQTIAQQQTVWNATAKRGLTKWVVIEAGLNDLDPTEAAAVAIARLQSLVASVRAPLHSSAKLLIAKLTPCRQRMTDLYGGINGPIAYQKWLDINTAINGGGATPITGVDGRVTAHVPLLGDGSDNLAAAYEIAGTTDHIHENNAGRTIIGTAWSDALTALGVL